MGSVPWESNNDLSYTRLHCKPGPSEFWEAGSGEEQWVTHLSISRPVSRLRSVDNGAHGLSVFKHRRTNFQPFWTRGACAATVSDRRTDDIGIENRTSWHGDTTQKGNINTSQWTIPLLVLGVFRPICQLELNNRSVIRVNVCARVDGDVHLSPSRVTLRKSTEIACRRYGVRLGVVANQSLGQSQNRSDETKDSF